MHSSFYTIFCLQVSFLEIGGGYIGQTVEGCSDTLSNSPVYANELNLKFTNENFLQMKFPSWFFFPIIPPSIQAVSYVRFSAYPRADQQEYWCISWKDYIIYAKDDADKRIQRLSFSPQAALSFKKLTERGSQDEQWSLLNISKKNFNRLKLQWRKFWHV